MSVRVRFPPSPTGFCHVGTARMAVVNFLFARKHKGQIVFRSEDTDKERSKTEYEEDIIESLQWLGLSWDEFCRQSERTEVYTNALKGLIDSGKAYTSQEESKKEAGKMVEVIRLKNPGTVITFNDVLRGDITFDTTELGDLVIARSATDPLYHFAVVVDDAEMKISHVIRGEDHISNTPRQILIQEALGYSRPIYAHYPLHLAADRSKLSKRKGDVAVRDYRQKGYLSEALLNYLAHLGWTPPSGREIMSLQEMIDEFELTHIHKSGAVFDMEKLRWYNREYIQKMSTEEFANQALPVLKETLANAVPWDEHVATRLVPVLRERVAVWEDIRDLAREGEFDYFFGTPTLAIEKISSKGVDAETTKRHLAHAATLFESLNDDQFLQAESVKNAVWEYASQEGRGAVLWPLRYCLTGKEKSPDPFIVASLIGKKETLSRVNTAINLLGA